MSRSEQIVQYSQARVSVLNRVLAERERQDEKWGIQDHDDLRWLGIFVEEGIEGVVRAVNGLLGDGEAGDVEEEITQAVAVGVAWLEAKERRRLRDGR